MSEEQRKEFASGILISDINSYIDTHQLEYEEWLKKRKLEQENNIKNISKKCVKGGKTDEIREYEVYKT